jgi:hypothetical protein
MSMAGQSFAASPHFSQDGYCGVGSARPDCRPSRGTVKYDCEGLGREALFQSPSLVDTMGGVVRTGRFFSVGGEDSGFQAPAQGQDESGHGPLTRCLKFAG